MKKLMTGNEAVARGAYEGGATFGSAYPGTPSTEIFENLPQYKENIYSEWAPNEKVALEAAYGAAIAGERSLCAMKHVGLNVAADPMFTAAGRAGQPVLCQVCQVGHGGAFRQPGLHRLYEGSL